LEYFNLKHTIHTVYSKVEELHEKNNQPHERLIAVESGEIPIPEGVATEDFVSNAVASIDLTPFVEKESLFYNGDSAKDVMINYNATESNPDAITATNDNNIYIQGFHNGQAKYNMMNIVLGLKANVKFFSSLAIGYNATCSSYSGIAIGQNSLSSSNESMAIGNDAQAKGDYSTAIGHYVEAGENSVAIGHNVNAATSNTISVGGSSITTINLGPLRITFNGNNLVFTNTTTNKSGTIPLS
jgi:hypothetical protein